MSTSQGQQPSVMQSSLFAYLAEKLLPPFAKKSIFGRPYVPFQGYLGCYELAYETGAVLGHAFRNDLPCVATLFCQPGREQDFIKFLRESGSEHISAVGASDSFQAFGVDHEEERLRSKWRSAGHSDAQIDQHKMEIEGAYKQIQFAISEGFALGAASPELVQHLWSSAYEQNIDPAEWDKLKAAGLQVSSEVPKPIPIAEREKELIPLVLDFANKFRRDALNHLTAFTNVCSANEGDPVPFCSK